MINQSLNEKRERGSKEANRPNFYFCHSPLLLEELQTPHVDMTDASLSTTGLLPTDWSSLYISMRDGSDSPNKRRLRCAPSDKTGRQALEHLCITYGFERTLR